MRTIIKAINWSALTFESVGFLMGIMLGALIGFHIAAFYFFMPWGVP